MKTLAISIVAAVVLNCIGCADGKVYVIHNDKAVTNNVSMQSFNDEHYVWETWQVGTNRVNNIDN